MLKSVDGALLIKLPKRWNSVLLLLAVLSLQH